MTCRNGITRGRSRDAAKSEASDGDGDGAMGRGGSGMRRGTKWGMPRHASVLALPLIAGIAGPATADTELNPRVSSGLTLTDNRDFEHDAESDAIFSITPAINLRQEGGRSTTFLDYSMSGQYAHRDTEFDVVHTLHGTNTLELVDDSFFLDSSASVDQRVIDNSEGVPVRENEASNNLSTVQRYSVSPVYVVQLGSFADSESRARVGYVTSDTDELSEETEYAVSQSFNSGRDFTSFQWSLFGTYIRTNREEQDDREQQTYRFDTETFVSREVTILAGIGYENIKDAELTNQPKGMIWDAGLRLTPGPKLTMEATYGERYEEQNIGARLDYKITSRTTLNASYTQTLTTEQQLLLSDLSFIGVDENGNLIDTRTGLPLADDFSPFSLSDDPFRRDILTVRFTHNRPRDRYSLTASHEVRESGSDDVAEIVKGVDATWQHDLSRSTSLSTSLGYDNIEFGGDDTGRTDDVYTIRASLSEQITSDVDATATYLFRHRDSNESEETATENAVLFTLTKTF